MREFERESWELGETPPVGAERRSGKPVTQIGEPVTQIGEPVCDTDPANPL